MDLFDSIQPAVERLAIADAEVTMHRRPDLGTDAAQAYADLAAECDWAQRSIVLAGGQQVLEARLTAWHGDEGMSYTYSGRRNEAAPWTPRLSVLRDAVSEIAGERFNSVLLNLYRDGSDSIGFHSDSERELGPDPIIASLSFGAERIFEMRPKKGREGATHRITLTDGSLLIMGRGTQRHWDHGIRKIKTPCGPRINATFRRIIR